MRVRSNAGLGMFFKAQLSVALGKDMPGLFAASLEVELGAAICTERIDVKISLLAFEPYPAAVSPANVRGLKPLAGGQVPQSLRGSGSGVKVCRAFASVWGLGSNLGLREEASCTDA